MAVATKTKGPASDSIMAADKMKPLLALSKREPVQAAIALTAEGDGVILLDKKAKPKKVMSMLRAEAVKAKLQLNNATLRFGRAEVDTDYDSGMVRFFINKDAPGNMRIKLVEVVKRIPYQKVEINVDASLEDEPEEDDGADAASAGAPAAVAETVPAPPAPPLAAPAAVDSAALGRELAALIGRIAQAAGADTGRRALLAQLAGDANGKLKAGDPGAAAEAMAKLRDAIETPPATGAPAPDADSLRKELAGLIGRIPQAAGDDAGKRGQLASLAGDANTSLKANDPGAAAAAIDKLKIALDAPDAKGSSPALAVWQTARTAAIASLNSLLDAINKASTHAERDAAIILLRAIRGNLTEVPDTPRKIAELEAYLTANDIVEAAETPNVFGIKVELRAPLMAALAGMR